MQGNVGASDRANHAGRLDQGWPGGSRMRRRSREEEEKEEAQPELPGVPEPLSLPVPEGSLVLLAVASVVVATSSG